MTPTHGAGGCWEQHSELAPTLHLARLLLRESASEDRARSSSSNVTPTLGLCAFDRTRASSSVTCSSVRAMARGNARGLINLLFPRPMSSELVSSVGTDPPLRHREAKTTLGAPGERKQQRSPRNASPAHNEINRICVLGDGLDFDLCKYGPTRRRKYASTLRKPSDVNTPLPKRTHNDGLHKQQPTHNAARRSAHQWRGGRNNV